MESVIVSCDICNQKVAFKDYADHLKTHNHPILNVNEK